MLRDNLELHGPKFGCGLGQCGACTVHIGGQAVRSCVMPISAVGARKVTTLDQAPKVLVDLIDRPGEPSWGASEPTACAIPAAIANAVFDATGARLREVPFTPRQVLAALARPVAA